jgi:hypothetical protein
MHRPVAFIGLCFVLAGGCNTPAPTSSPTPSPTPSPALALADAPTLQNGTPFFTAENGSWVFRASVDPNGSPTDVVLEYGLGKTDPPAFGNTVAVAKGTLVAGPVQARVELPIERGFCVRFTARSEAGSTFGEAYCQPGLVQPAPSS